MMRMTTEEAVRRLRDLVKSREEVKEIYRRKRSWRPSEIAMSIADVERDIEALRFAIEVLDAK